MASVPTPNGISATMVYTYNSQRICNVFHFTRPAPATLANLVSLGGILQSWDSASNKGLRHSSCSLVLISLKALDSAGSPFYDHVVSPAIAGTSTGTAMPSYCTVAVKHTTGLGGRSYRGRTYLCGLATGIVSAPDNIVPASAASVNTIYSTMRANTLAGGFTFCVASFYSGVDGSGRAIQRATGVMTPVTASECGIGLDTQRHRKIAGVV